MSKNTVSKISNAFSTGGGGVNFEQKVQAMFLLSLLVDGFCPAMNEQTKSVWFQAKMRYDVDDLAVFTYRGQAEGKLLCQIKHSITISETNQTFQEVITAAWSDFQKDKFATVYKGNIIKNLIMDCQSYTKYRPNETTGGIFVSWRRKEELPTGA